MLNGLAQNHDLFKVICFKFFSMKMMKNHIVVHDSRNMKMRYTTFCIIHWHVYLKSWWLKKRKAAARSHLQNSYLLWGTNFMIFLNEYLVQQYISVEYSSPARVPCIMFCNIKAEVIIFFKKMQMVSHHKQS